MPSIHDKLSRVRKPRVHITYDVETEGAVVQKELPFVVGVLGDFSADPSEPLKPLNDRKFIQIDRDNFDQVLARMTPGLRMKVANTLADDGSQMSVELAFKSMADFDPASVVERVEPLRKLMEARNQLRDLLSKADRSENLESLLEQILSNETDLKTLGEQLGVGKEEGAH
ncbi:type VI secretion system contractile sheath small subunit [Methylobacterium oryzihabitans]|uniref:Type VI secretion system contractile sheath small subunit n=1 Tax=Methylobacterium oryzihabitans TaxID=2499852 RepID=A0A3S2XKD1_9HYPH|nr:type VI secretion system contractile sheath small subunit [Methylobacterium oryzihabitans]RVU16928.1 type VI secretion system contractile sheath small subunit [Methylobacterium oryzihabitans]